MDASKLSQLTKKFSISNIEKHIVYNYLEHNNIDITPCNFIKDYLNKFTPDNLLLNGIKSAGIMTIDDIAMAMEVLIPSSDKKVNGAFFTPSYIADYIIESIAPTYNSKVMDPSCGSGAFLLATVKYFTKYHNKRISDCIKENIYGADILSYNIHRCHILLSLLGLSVNEVVDVSDMNLICCDSLQHDWSQRFDAVVGNPPYVKFQDMDDYTRKSLSSKYQTTQFGTYNLYFAFFELGLHLLTSNGKLGYITPNNYFTSLSGECLRSFFQKEQCVYQIVDFNATKVFDVQTYTAISFLNKGKNDIIKYDRITTGISPCEFLKNITWTENSYSNLSEKKWRLLCDSERDNIFKIENSGESIGNLFKICVGIATLKDEVYFIDPIAQDNKYYHIKRNGQEYLIEKELTRPVVKISEMKKTSDIKGNKRRIIFPYKYNNGKAIAIPEETIALHYPECYKYFLSVQDILRNRGKGKHIYTPFYAYGRTQGLNRMGVKLLTPTFSKSPRFLYDNNPDGFFTNGYGIYLKEQTDSLFGITLISKPENLDVMQKILNSYIMEYYVDKTSVAIEGGYPCYQKNFIERFSIPNFSSSEINEIRSISNSSDLDKYLINKYHLNMQVPKRS